MDLINGIIIISSSIEITSEILFDIEESSLTENSGSGISNF